MVTWAVGYTFHHAFSGPPFTFVIQAPKFKDYKLQLIYIYELC